MKNISVKALRIADIKVLRYERFVDSRGYFTETFRKSEMLSATDGAVASWEVVQANESHSRSGVVRGLHFQWHPYMGKLVRTITGHMVDLILDIRLGSPHFGRLIAYDMPAPSAEIAAEWIWIPPGFAHGNFFLDDTTIEYLCSGEYAGSTEAGISPLSVDIDWSICEDDLKKQFDDLVHSDALIISDKDRNGVTLETWRSDPRAKNFVYGELP